MASYQGSAHPRSGEPRARTWAAGRAIRAEARDGGADQQKTTKIQTSYRATTTYELVTGRLMNGQAIDYEREFLYLLTANMQCQAGNGIERLWGWTATVAPKGLVGPERERDKRD